MSSQKKKSKKNVDVINEVDRLHDFDILAAALSKCVPVIKHFGLSLLGAVDLEPVQDYQKYPVSFLEQCGMSKLSGGQEKNVHHDRVHIPVDQRSEECARRSQDARMILGIVEYSSNISVGIKQEFQCAFGNPNVRKYHCTKGSGLLFLDVIFIDGLMDRICQFHFVPSVTAMLSVSLYEMSRQMIGNRIRSLLELTMPIISAKDFDFRLLTIKVGSIIEWFRNGASSSVQFQVIRFLFKLFAEVESSSEVGKCALSALNASLVPLKHVWNTGPVPISVKGGEAIR
jgi:hypothetical protein